MGVLDTLKSAGSTVGDNLKNNLLGITEKAVIEIIDLRERKVGEDGEVPLAGNTAGQKAQFKVKDKSGNTSWKTSMADSGWVQKSIKDINASAWEAAKKSAIKEAVAQGKDPKEAVLPDEIESIAGDFEGGVPKYFVVPFNPNTLRLTGHSGGLVKKTIFSEDKSNDKGSIEYGPGKTYIDMSVSLLFDKVDPQDAFLEDKLAMSATSVLKGVTKAALVGKGVKKNTVQPEVEGFIAALRNERTRTITFHWGDFNITGILRNVNAVYTMFNINGQPIRATVDLTMTCADSDLAKESIKLWNDIYNESFGDGSESFVQVSQQAKSLINI